MFVRENRGHSASQTFRGFENVSHCPWPLVRRKKVQKCDVSFAHHSGKWSVNPLSVRVHTCVCMSAVCA